MSSTALSTSPIESSCPIRGRGCCETFVTIDRITRLRWEELRPKGGCSSLAADPGGAQTRAPSRLASLKQIRGVGHPSRLGETGKEFRMKSLTMKVLMAAVAVVMFSTVTAIAGAQGPPGTAGPSVCVPGEPPSPRVSAVATCACEPRCARAVPTRARSTRSTRSPCASTGVRCCRCRCDSGRLNSDVRRVLDRARVPGH